MNTTKYSPQTFAKPDLIILSLVFILGVFSCTTGESNATFDPAVASPGVELVAPGLISTQLNERDFAIAPDGLEIMHSLSNADNAYRAIVVLKSVKGKWQTPKVAPFSGFADDLEPFYSHDGTKLFFASNRLVNASDTTNDFNIWFSEKENSVWGDAQYIDPPVNSDADEYYPSVAENGNLYFTSSRSNSKGLEDIFVSRYFHEEYQVPVSLDTTINTEGYEFNAFIAPDESYLLFGSYGRPDGYGGGDIYISLRTSSGGWEPAINLGEDINSSKLDYCPFVDVKHGMFYFSSDRRAERPADTLTYKQLVDVARSAQNGSGNIYRVPWQMVFKEFTSK